MRFSRSIFLEASKADWVLSHLPLVAAISSPAIASHRTELFSIPSETSANMDSQPHPSLSPTDHLHRAGASVSTTIQRCISSIYSNRLHHVVAHALILLLRFGQVAATAILSLVFGYMVYEHHTHWCVWNPSRKYCSENWYWAKNPTEVPWSYGVVIGTVSFWIRFVHWGDQGKVLGCHWLYTTTRLKSSGCNGHH